MKVKTKMTHPLLSALTVGMLCVGICACSASTESEDTAAQADKTLVVKGLYMRMPGDEALKACQKMLSSSKDLAVVDFRKGIEREKDEATKAAEKAEWEKLVKSAEEDIDCFQAWHDEDSCLYAPQSTNYRRHSGAGSNRFLEGTRTLAERYGYQLEWMLLGKHPATTSKNTDKPKFVVYKKVKSADVKALCNSEEFIKGLDACLYDKGLRRVQDDKYLSCKFLRLVMEDGKGNPIDKAKLVKEVALLNSGIFAQVTSNEQKMKLAEKMVDSYCEWFSLSSDALIGSGFGIPDPERTGIRREDLVRDQEMDLKDQKALQEKCDKLAKIKNDANEMENGADRRKDQENLQKLKTSCLKDSAELAQLTKLVSDLKVAKAASERNKNNRGFLKQYKTAYEKYKTAYDAYAKRKEEINANKNSYEEMKKKVKASNQKLNALKREIAEKESDIEQFKESLRRKAQNDYLCRRDYYGEIARTYHDVLANFVCNCGGVVEIAVFAIPAEKLEMITESITLPEKEIRKYLSKLDNEICEKGKDKRKRIFFEKNLEDAGGKPFYRLVPKNTNGVDVAKEEVVKNWLAARGQNPPDGKLRIEAKNLIRIAVREDGVNEDKWKSACDVWIDAEDKVKEVFFNEEGMARIFNAGDLSSEEFAQSLVKNYSDIPSMDVNVTSDFETNDGTVAMKTYTWTYKDPRGFQVQILDRDYYSGGGQRIQLRQDLQLQIAMSLNKTKTKWFDFKAIKPESARKFD